MTGFSIRVVPMLLAASLAGAGPAWRANDQPPRRKQSFHEYLLKSDIRSISTASFMLAGAETPRAGENDYPTASRADYVIGCMAANGNTREALLKCSCAIDTIAGLMPFSHYERAETALSLQLGGGVGGRVGLFRDPPQIKAVIEELRRAQAEANLQCR
jgi:hypothetical protein